MQILNYFTAEFLIVIFFAITYFFSVFEKATQWKGTVSYYKSHFNNTVLEKPIQPLLALVVALEIIAFLLLVFGIYFIVTAQNFEYALLGLKISALTLICFLIAQRIAKDYPGAMNITVYFILNIIGIYLLI